EAASSEASIDGEGGSDNCVGTVTTASCAGTAHAVNLRDPNLVSVGETTSVPGLTQVYLVGSNGDDTVTANLNGANLEFSLSGASFDPSLAEPGRCAIAANSASCPVSGLLDSVLLAGMGGDDAITANVPDGVGVVELGGTGADTLNGSASEDVLVD